MDFPISGQELVQLIPQKEPFVFISSLLSVDERRCTTTFTFDPNHALCNYGNLSIGGIIENMAQSSGCKMGYENFMKGKPARAAFIGEVREFTYSRLPKAGELLTTEITIENMVFGSVVVIAGKVKVGREAIASCKMKVFFETDEEEVI
ncbi:MAG: hypothetical protein KA841_06395, partial [Chitinophagales bacterium]|nr:hypothetical protein [Chitinophagales bacterium]